MDLARNRLANFEFEDVTALDCRVFWIRSFESCIRSWGAIRFILLAAYDGPGGLGNSQQFEDSFSTGAIVAQVI